jgi:hypothetical protein
MTFIDTPGLDTFYWGDNQFLAKKKDSEVETSLQVQNLILRLVNNSDRLLLFVEECKDKNLMSIASRIASAVDPVFVRSIFVYSKFHNKLRDFYNVNEVNSYLASAPKNAQTFFVSLPSSQVREDSVESEKKFRKRLVQTYLRDVDYLDLLQYNTEFAHMIGIHRIRRHIQHVVRRKYRESIPTKLDEIIRHISETEDRLSTVRRKKGLINVSKLRHLANEYILHYNGVIAKLVEGSTDVEAAVYGQNLDDEREQLDLSAF